MKRSLTPWLLVLLGCALCALSNSASAQPSSERALAEELHRGRRLAEDQERDGHYAACAHTYASLFEKAPDSERGDELLYNAGVCYEHARLVGHAIASFSRLEQRFPSSALAARALLRRAGLAGSIADYLQSARAHERYATRYGGEKDAPNALLTAIHYRMALGDDRAAIASISRFLRTYQRRLKIDSAAVLWSLAELYERAGNRPKEKETYLRYLKSFGSKAGRDRLLIAHARLGEIAWQQSCPHASTDGSCTRIRRVAKRHKQCGPDSVVPLEVVPRSKRHVAEAQQYFAKAIALAQRGALEAAPDPRRQAAAVSWLAAARFYRAEQGYEEFLGAELPANLNFSASEPAKREDSTRRMAQWKRATQSRMAKLIRAYQDVRSLAGGQPSWAIASAARVGQIALRLRDIHLAGAIPKAVWAGPQAKSRIDAHCTALTGRMQSLEDLSVASFAFGMDLSTKTNWFDDWSRLCERALSRLRPDEFPLAREVHGQAYAAAFVTPPEKLLAKAPRP